MTQQNQETQQQEAPLTARETIRAAVDEYKEKIAKEEKEDTKSSDTEVIPNKDTSEEPDTSEKEVKEIKQSKETKQPKDIVAPKSEDKKETSEIKVAEITEEKETKETKVEPKAKVPFGVPKEIRAEWDNLSPNTQNYLSKVVKENLDTKAAEGRRSHMRDVEQVLTPYMPEIQRIGVTPAQIVKRLLDYSDALAHPQHKYAALQSLANNYGIDLSLFTSDPDNKQTSQQQTQQTHQQQTQQQVDPAVYNELAEIKARLSHQDNIQRSANDKAALDYVNSWAGFDATANEYKQKPYFPYVRQSMFNLIYNGTVPLVNGQIDLDGAYEAACLLDPQIRELIEEDRVNQQKMEMQRKNTVQQTSIDRAKKAGSSIRSGAPAPVNRNINTRSTINGKPLSARDSIRMAIQEVRGS